MQQGDDRWCICVYVNIVRLKASIYFPFSFFFFLLCACAVNVYVCSHVCIHVYVCACVYTSQADTRCLLSQISTLCVSVGYSNEPGTPQFLFVSSSNGIPVSASRILGLQTIIMPTWLLCAIWNPNSCLHACIVRVLSSYLPIPHHAYSKHTLKSYVC